MNSFVGCIMVAGFNFAPRGWALCNGQLVAINQNQALFSLFGTTYGGNGVQNFALPNLQGCVTMSFGTDPFGTSYTLGQRGGEAQHTLNVQETPTHLHSWKATSTGPNTNVPTNGVLSGIGMYTNAASQAMSGAEITPSGGSQPHENRSPFLVLNFCVALVGIFPSRT